MELRQLRVFVTIAEEGSFTRAADRLHVVQSAISASLRTLEQELGVTLLERGPVGLTDAGRALMGPARDALAAAERGVEAIDEVRGGLRGTVTLGVMQGRGFGAEGGPRAPQLLKAFAAEHPAVKVVLRHVGGSVAMAEEVRSGRLDLAILGLPDGDWPGLSLTALAREPLVLLCHEEHPLAGAADVALAELVAERFADLPAGWGIRMAAEAAFAGAGLQREVTYEMNDVLGVVDFAVQNLAVTIFPAYLGTASPVLRAVPLRDGPTFVTSLAEPTERTPSAAASALAASVRRAAPA